MQTCLCFFSIFSEISQANSEDDSDMIKTSNFHEGMQYAEIFRVCKNEYFQMKNDNFLIFAQTIDSGYTLEPPQ